MPGGALIPAILVFVAVAMGVIALVLVVEWIRDRIQARTVVRQLEEFSDQGFDTDAQSLIRRGQNRADWLDDWVARFPRLGDLEELLRRGGGTWSLQGFLTLTFGLSAGLGLATLLVSQNVLMGAFLAVIGAMIPYIVARRRATQRTYKFEEQLPDAIDLIGRAIRAGHPISSGFKMVADEAEPPVATEFRTIFEEQRFGLPFEDSMFAFADRMRLVDVRILVVAILIHRQVGGNLAEVLDNLAYVIRERFKLRRQLRVITAQGRLSGYVLALLPIVLGIVIYLLNSEYMMTLFTTTIGRFLLVTAAIFQTLGYLWIRRIVDIDF